MEIDVLFAAVAVSELERSQAWYERLLGGAPDMLVNPDEVMWHLVGAGWLYLTVDAERAGASLLTAAVDDLDATVAEIGERGLTVDAIEIVPDAGRKARYRDPDGNTVWLIEVVQRGA